MRHRLGQLDFLRGIALLGVIAVHSVNDYSSVIPSLNGVLELGRHGVELFFAVSGYTMMMMFGSYGAKWQSPVKVFYIKRFLRIYPLFAIAAFAYLPMSLNPSYSDPDGTSLLDMLKVLTLTGGMHPSTLNAVVPGGWTITNEMYFYLLFPAIALYLIKVRPVYIAALVCVVAVVPTLPDAEFFGLPAQQAYLLDLFQYRSFFNQFLLFLTGILAYRAVEEGRGVDFWWIWLPAALLAAGLYKYMAYSAFLKAVILSFGCYVAILGLFRLKEFSGGWLSRYGRVTYTGYISHFAILAFINWVLGFTGLTSYARFEIIFPLAAILTYWFSTSVVQYTELYWQRIADRICEGMPMRVTAAGGVSG